eukprot:g2739.t1
MDPYSGSSSSSNTDNWHHPSAQDYQKDASPTQTHQTTAHSRQRNQRANAFKAASSSAGGGARRLPKRSPPQFKATSKQQWDTGSPGVGNSPSFSSQGFNNAGGSSSAGTGQFGGSGEAAAFVGAALPGGEKMFENPMAQAGVNYLQAGVQQQFATYIPGITDLYYRFKYHFDVDQYYVMNKLKLLLYPKQTSWARKQKQGDGGTQYQRKSSDAGLKSEVTMAPPREDVNAPDMYIPLMAFTTYAIISSLLYGESGQFTPEVLWSVMTMSLSMQALQCLLLRIGFHFHSATISFIDLISYTGYIYVGLCINTLAGIFLGRLMYYLALAWTSGALGYFYIKTLAKAMFSEPQNSFANQMGPPQNLRQIKKSKQYFLFAVGLAQPLLMWFLAY